ncbi:hypothetical protein HZA43_05315 [Candidatus Peregrinibacteria bacterium]|nr:hypothetical protein [Candidatus Peregrinibacteria bacterium]
MTTTIHIDDATKKTAQKLAEELGFSFNAFINALLKKAIREGGVDLRKPRRLTENGFTPEFERSILDADKEGGYMAFDSVDELIKYSKSEK